MLALKQEYIPLGSPPSRKHQRRHTYTQLSHRYAKLRSTRRVPRSTKCAAGFGGTALFNPGRVRPAFSRRAR